MKTQGDTKRPRAVKAEFDDEFRATANGGAVLAEQTMRSLGVRRSINKHLPARSEDAKFSVEDAVYALMAGLTVEGKGIQAAEQLRDDKLLTNLFCLGDDVVSPTTTYRALCELAGLPQRKKSDCYVPSGRSLPALDMFGHARKEPKMRRVVPEVPEAATDERREALDRFSSAVAVRCAKATQRNVMRLCDWYVVFGDATDLEVDGNCFDAAHMGRDGRKILRWQTLTLGPVLVAQQLHEGNVDEGLSMPRVLKQGEQTVRAILGAKASAASKARVLSLLDAAYFEKQVVDPLTDELHWDFIVCANQQRNVLRRLAEEQPARAWGETGADARRGWRTSQVSCFAHRPEGWDRPVTIVARRWIEEGQLDGTWHYSFLATRIEPAAVPESLLNRHSYPSAIWMLYGTKQGRENHYKTPLRDFGLHNPPSGRLGVNQALYAIATAAVNVAMVMRYRVVAREERGIAFWRLRQRYFRIAGRVRQSARCLTVHLSGANVEALRQVLWRKAFAAAGRL